MTSEGRRPLDGGATGGWEVLRGVNAALAQVSAGDLARAVALLDGARRRRSRVYALGNGGSAATASHLACDLAKRAGCCARERLRAVALADAVPTTTAWANDASYARALAAQLEVLLEPEDVVVALSVSGCSPNVVAALAAARAQGALSLGLLGADGGVALGMVDVALHVPAHDYGVVETVHLGLAHALTAELRARRGGRGHRCPEGEERGARSPAGV